MAIPLRRGGYANVTATLALVIALGGTGYAAATLPRHSVGTAQLKNDAVNGTKVANNSLTMRDLKKYLPRGQTLTGTFGGTFAGAVDDYFSDSVSFPLPTKRHVTVDITQAGDNSDGHCPGTPANPKAKPGYLCVYVDYADDRLSDVSYYGIDGDQDFRRGGILYWTAEAADNNLDMVGTWAVTAR